MYYEPPERQDPIEIAEAEFRTARIRLASFLFACMVASLLAWGIAGSLGESGLYFITIPGMTAILLSLLPSGSPRSEFGLFRGTLIAIFASAIVVREGFICVLMASPLILLVVGMVVWSGRKKPKHLRAFVLPVVLLLGLGAEGAVFDLPNQIEASETRLVDASGDELLGALDASGDLPELEPLLFSLPFPRPTAFVGEGAEVGDYRIVEFGDGGHITLEITDRTSSSITWATVEDTTPIAGWITFHETTATWTETSAGLELTISITFERNLSPAFYFDPLQRWGVGEMAEVLADMIEHNLELAEEGTNA